MKPLIEVSKITKIFHRKGQLSFPAIDNVSFSLYPGESLSIIGESGSGKTTIAKAITKLIDLTDGNIFLHGENINQIKGQKLRDMYREIQMVFQSPINSFDPRRTLGDSVGESLRNKGLSHKETKANVKNLFQQCGLPKEYIKKYPYEVSGGQCQRAAIARALAVRPKILICDEITSSLDVTIQAQIMKLLKTLQTKHGLACLFICHNFVLVQNFCTRVLIINEGKIIEEGTPNEIIRFPKNDYTKRLVDSALYSNYNNKYILHKNLNKTQHEIVQNSTIQLIQKNKQMLTSN